MNCWLNIHYPPPETESQPCYVYLQRKNEHFISEFNIGDTAFIYQTLTSPPKVKITDKKGSRWLKLTKGKGGIIAVVKITNNFVKHEENSYYPVGNRRQVDYIGYFNTSKVEAGREFVPLKEIKEAYLGAGLPCFNPCINGGLRKLKPDECRIMKRLVGFDE